MNPVVYLFLLPVLIGFVWVWVARSERRQQFVQQRLTKLTVDDAVDEAEPSLVRKLHDAPAAIFLLSRKAWATLNSAFEAAGNRIGLLHLVIAGLISAILVIVFASRLLAVNPAWLSPLGVTAGIGGAFVLLRGAQARYRRRFLDVFPDALDLVRRAVKSGLPVNEALAVAGKEIADPVGSELRRAMEQVQIGVHMNDALQETADRIRVPDFRFLVVALVLQQRTGGSLAETLGNLSGVLRARKALRQKARALTAEAKASAGVLAILPFVVGGLMFVINHDLAMSLVDDSRGRFMVGVAALSLAGGLTAMYVIVRRALR
jgi:Flp pilus assembly protein TadB